MSIKSQFFNLYILQELPANDIKLTMNLTDRQYITLVKIAKSMDKTDISLDDYLIELNRQYLVVDDQKMKIELLKLIGDIVKSKHKIPISKKKDFSIQTTAPICKE